MALSAVPEGELKELTVKALVQPPALFMIVFNGSQETRRWVERVGVEGEKVQKTSEFFFLSFSVGITFLSST